MNSSHKPRPAPDQTLARLAQRQHGVVYIGQLLTIGLSREDVAYRVRIGRLHRLHRGVYAVGHRHLTERSTFIAAVFAIGDGTALGNRAATALYGFLPWRGGDVDVIVRRRVAQREGIRVHVASEEFEIVRRDSIPVTTPARTLLDLSRTERHKVARRAVNQALVLRRVTLPLLYREAAGPRGARLRAILADASPTRSELEDVAVEFLKRHGFSHLETNVRVAGWEVDVLLPGRVVIELDSRFHDNPLQRATDERKQAELEAAGFRVERLRWKDVFCAPPTSLAA